MPETERAVLEEPREAKERREIVMGICSTVERLRAYPRGSRIV